jgi:hypothetical protein
VFAVFVFLTPYSLVQYIGSGLVERIAERPCKPLIDATLLLHTTSIRLWEGILGRIFGAGASLGDIGRIIWHRHDRSGSQQCLNMQPREEVKSDKIRGPGHYPRLHYSDNIAAWRAATPPLNRGLLDQALRRQLNLRPTDTDAPLRLALATVNGAGRHQVGTPHAPRVYSMNDIRRCRLDAGRRRNCGPKVSLFVGSPWEQQGMIGQPAGR